MHIAQALKDLLWIFISSIKYRCRGYNFPVALYHVNEMMCVYPPHQNHLIAPLAACQNQSTHIQWTGHWYTNLWRWIHSRSVQKHKNWTLYDTQIYEDGCTQEGLSKNTKTGRSMIHKFMKIDVLGVCQRHKCDFHMQIGHANIWITLRAKE